MGFLIDELITEQVRTVGISGHTGPDGDCVGSCMGLYLYLNRNYPDIRTDVFLEPIPRELRIIKDTDRIRTDFETDVASYDLFFVLDCEKERTGKAEAICDAAKQIVNIDHHISNKGGAGINVIEPDASSVCELISGAIDIERADSDIAMALYTGIVTDTGMFHYSNTSPDTMRTAARLMEFRFDHSSLVEHIYLERTYSQNRTMGEMLAESRLYLDGRCIVASITRERMEREQITKDDLDQIVSQMNLTAGVECAVFLYETPEGRKKISLRSKGRVNVSGIAQQIGGGGHVRAAGCTTDGEIDEIVARLLPMIGTQLMEYDRAHAEEVPA
ncbi:MAG: bifunctional oligoribonuclease/PAP phosphatase NrnA [Lachnospiraceae bacterium]|nr:bifunctional oligoribonuclease/PAP phosphatase NrnA [Lachnospiraceae bacterium]